MTDYRVLVTGSRDWEDVFVILDAMQAIPLLPGVRPVLVHGDCRTGADMMAGLVAYRLGWAVEPHPAQWRKNGIYNPQAGLLRNRQMVELGANLCLAFIRNGSRGASHCARLAEAAGIKTRYYRDDGPFNPGPPPVERTGL